MNSIETLCENYMAELCKAHPDPSHDLLHVKRVVELAKKLAQEEGANLEIVIPAAYLHDCIYISKTDPRRKEASKLSADKALTLLMEWSYPETYFKEIHHAVMAHSFSSGVEAKTLEAQIVQDADRLDAVGAIGIARCFAFSGLAKRAIYHPHDSFCNVRKPDDQENTLDHFFIKLLKLNQRLHTSAARKEGQKRQDTMKLFLASLKDEISSSLISN